MRVKEKKRRQRRKGGGRPKLIELLTKEKFGDSKYTPSFLLTLSFKTPFYLEVEDRADQYNNCHPITYTVTK